MQQRLDRTDLHEGTELVYFGYGAVDDLVAVHVEQKGLEANSLVDRTISVDDAAAAEHLVVESDQDEVSIIVEATFERAVCQLIDVLAQ